MHNEIEKVKHRLYNLRDVALTSSIEFGLKTLDNASTNPSMLGTINNAFFATKKIFSIPKRMSVYNVIKSKIDNISANEKEEMSNE